MNIKVLLKKTTLYKVYRHYLSERHKRRFEHANRVFLEESTSVFQHFCNTLNEENLVFWMEFGTLLGYYREHDFIKHDLDLDMGTYLSNANRVRDALEKNGFVLVRKWRIVNDDGIKECYQYKDLTVDIVYFREDGDVMYCNSFTGFKDMRDKKNLNKELPFMVKRINVPNNGFHQVEFKGCSVYVPNKIEDYLSSHYGKSFMTPNPKFNSKTDAPNVIYYPYEEKQGIGYFKVAHYRL